MLVSSALIFRADISATLSQAVGQQTEPYLKLSDSFPHTIYYSYIVMDKASSTKVYRCTTAWHHYGDTPSVMVTPGQ